MNVCVPSNLELKTLHIGRSLWWSWIGHPITPSKTFQQKYGRTLCSVYMLWRTRQNVSTWWMVKELSLPTRGALHMRKSPLVSLLNRCTDRTNRQWGNVIALQAAYMDPFFRNLGAISTHTLTTLIKKTLDFLHNIAQPSSSIWQDIKILLHMAKNVTQLLPTEYTIPDQPSSRSNGDIHNYSSRYEDSNGQGTRPRAMTMH